MNTQTITYKDSDSKFLFERLNELRGQERSTIAELVVIIEEIDRRELYKELDYPSLFVYLTDELGYSGGSATRRIQAARLYRRFPSIYNKIKTGDYTLTQLCDSYTEIMSKGLPVLNAIKKMSRGETRHHFKNKNAPRGMRISDPIALPALMSKIPSMKLNLRNSKEDWASTALQYIEHLEKRKGQLEQEIRRLRSK